MNQFKKLLLLLMCFASFTAKAQPGSAQISILNFTVKQKLPADVSTWNSVPASVLLVAKYMGQGNVVGSKLVLQIKKGSARVCGNDMQSATFLDAFQTRNFSANELTGAFTNCPKLSPGSYTLCAQFFGEERKEKSAETCRVFTIEDEVQVQESYSPPQNITPGIGKIFRPSEISGAVNFRWTPLVPKPKEQVTYKLRVWQLMQGQNSTQAMRTNQPIVTKDVDNITQAIVTNIYTGPCRPPYLCDYVWNVQAVDKNGKALGTNNGTSELSSFTVSDDENITGPTLVAPADGKAFASKDMTSPIQFRWTPLVPKPQQPVTYRLRVWQLMQGETGAQVMRERKPIVTKDVADITEASVSGIYTGPCRPPYLCDYVWQVQALDRTGRPIGEVEGNCELWSFKIAEDAAISGPTLVAPVDGKSFTPNDMSSPVQFRWTPLVPKPQEPVTYRLRVWQLMQGQNSTQAMRTNKPIVTKDVADIAEASVSGIYTGPCRPPYLCDYVWQVQALDKAGKPTGSDEGKSEAWSFKVQNNIDIQIDSLKVGCCINGKQSIYLKIKNNLGTSVNIVAVKYKVNGVGASINLIPIAPPLTQLVAGNGTVVFTSSINCIDAANFLKFLVDAEDVADPDNKETEVKSDTLTCRCDACDEKNFSLTAPTPSQINFANNILSFSQPLTIVSVKPVKSIKAELVYFEMIPENDYCIPCNKDAATYGHFTNGTNSMEWNTVNSPQNFNITTPQMTPCCSAVFRWCIRYKIEFKDCTTCNKLVCYEKRKEGCDKVLDHK